MLLRWNRYRNKSQHRKSTLEKKILPPLQQGFEPATFQSRVRRSNHWAIPAPCRHMYFLQRPRYKLGFGLDSTQQRKRTRIIIQLVIVILVFQRGCTGLTSLSFETMRMTHLGPCRPCPAYGSAIVFEKKVGRKV